MADTYTVMGVTYDTASGLPISSIEKGATYSSHSETGHTHLIIFTDGRTERHPVTHIPEGGAIIYGSETDGGKYYNEQLKIKEAEEKAKKIKAAQLALEKKKSQRLLEIGPLEGQRPSPDKNLTFRYPADTITSETDYVFFQFGKYVAPFSEDQNQIRKEKFQRGKEEIGWDRMGKVERRQIVAKYVNHDSSIDRYNNSTVLKPHDGDAKNPYESIMLPIPQDLGHEIGQVWQGKQWTMTGRAAAGALGAGNFSDAAKTGRDVAGLAKAAQASLTEMALNLIPGVGGNITFNDLTGATQGIVINPNAELMYDSPEMREIGMVFKMVPRTPEESQIIRRICQSFRKHSMPKYGGVDESDSDFSSNAAKLAHKMGLKKNDDKFTGAGQLNNFIRVPDLCKFTFMHGNKVHPHLVQFKPCAINKVEVTYTPDGNYATYGDGAPAAVELRLNFMETKTIFAGEVNYDGVSY